MFLFDTIIYRPIKNREEKETLLKNNIILGIYNEATIIFISKESSAFQYWAILENKRVCLTKREVFKMGLLKRSK